MQINKLTWRELTEKISEHNSQNNIKNQYGDSNPLKCVVVFKDVESWGKEYPLESRSYSFRSDNKYFLPDMIGSSIFASSLDDTDPCVRLERYLPEWVIDYCYIEN